MILFFYKRIKIKTIKAIKNNLIKFFPMAGEMFKVHIVTTSGTEIICDFM
jgi:hypothetical protein